MKYNIAFSGSGFRLGAHIGAMKRLAKEPDFELGAVGGTSGGALMAAFIALYNKPEAIYEAYLKLDTDDLIEFNFTALRWCSYSKGKKINELLEKHFGDMTIKQLVDRGNVEWINILATDINTGRSYVFNPESTPNAKVKDAVRASCAFPFVLTPVKAHTGELLLDGGLTNNMPVNMFPPHLTKRENTKTLGINVITKDSSEYFTEVKGILKIGWRLINIMMESLSRAHIRTADLQYDAETLHVDVTGISSIFDQDMTDKEKAKLKEAGYGRVDAYLTKDAAPKDNA